MLPPTRPHPAGPSGDDDLIFLEEDSLDRACLERARGSGGAAGVAGTSSSSPHLGLKGGTSAPAPRATPPTLKQLGLLTNKGITSPTPPRPAPPSPLPKGLQHYAVQSPEKAKRSLRRDLDLQGPLPPEPAWPALPLATGQPSRGLAGPVADPSGRAEGNVNGRDGAAATPAAAPLSRGTDAALAAEARTTGAAAEEEVRLPARAYLEAQEASREVWRRLRVLQGEGAVLEGLSERELKDVEAQLRRTQEAINKERNRREAAEVLRGAKRARR
jgi:hypothetical protein